MIRTATVFCAMWLGGLAGTVLAGPHRAHNAGRGRVKILTVYAGAEGVPNSVSLPDD